MLPIIIMEIESDADRMLVERLYYTCRSAMLRRAKEILGDEDGAEEAVQDALVRLIRHMDTVREIPAAEQPCYLMMLNRTAALDIYRKRKRETALRQELEQAPNHEPPEAALPDELLINEEKINILMACVKELPQRDRDVLICRYMMDMSNEEIAPLAGVAAGSVRMLLTRARRRAFALYRQKGGHEE